ncbi:MAG: hypothetical protein IT572_05050, partial [Deltaproteobacteria bacterium]|nr:hypothetical protein [Deltaproteobacteria bacterium]
MERSGPAKLSPLVERGASVPAIPEEKAQADFQRRFGESKPGRGAAEFFIDYGRIRGGSGSALANVAMPFRPVVYANGLFGGPAHLLDFRSPGQTFTFGSKSSTVRNYRALDGSESGQPKAWVSNRDGFLHHPGRVQDLETRSPDFINLFRNAVIRPEQATIEPQGEGLLLKNLSREALVWVLEGATWVPVGAHAPKLSKDGSWVLFGKNPNELEGNSLDPQAHTVLRVEQHRAKPFGPAQWRMIEFVPRDPAELEKISAVEAYLAALLGQSPEWTAWRFRGLLGEMQKAEWSLPQQKEWLNAMIAADPIQAELRLAQAAGVVQAARETGWSFQELRGLLLEPAIAKHLGLISLTQLPVIMETASKAWVSHSDLTGLLRRMSRWEKPMAAGLARLPRLLEAWRGLGGGGPRFHELLDFIDRTEATVSFLERVFDRLPGGSDLWMKAVRDLFPAMIESYGFRGNTLAELSLEIAEKILDHSLETPPADGRWAVAAIQVLPRAFEVLFGLRFRVAEQREILGRVAEEQGANFA